MKMRRAMVTGAWVRVLFIAACCIAGLGTLAAAASGANSPGDERILSFLSDIRVEPDASLEVAETIRIDARGDRVRHGLFRDFPTEYERDGRRIVVGFDVQSVERDGVREPWRIEPLDGAVRIRIGDEHVLLTSGAHSYTIRYRTTGQLGRGAASDELYWNVTGDGWPFAIDEAEVRVHLPAPARFGDRSVYTGMLGSRASDARLIAESPGEIAFRTTRRLEQGEGFTIAVAWPRGVVSGP